MHYFSRIRTRRYCGGRLVVTELVVCRGRGVLYATGALSDLMDSDCQDLLLLFQQHSHSAPLRMTDSRLVKTLPCRNVIISMQTGISVVIECNCNI